MTAQSQEIVITAANNYTAVGHGALMTAASVRAGITRFEECGFYKDRETNPITMAEIKGLDGQYADRAERLIDIVEHCLEEMLNGYFVEKVRRPSQIHLFLGVAAPQRSGPRFDNDCLRRLQDTLTTYAAQASAKLFPQGNPAAVYALEEATRVIADQPDALCIVGAVDCLLNPLTLDEFEKDRRLKSESRDRAFGLIPAEAVGFMAMESLQTARQRKKKILAHLAGVGTAQEPAPFVSDDPGTAQGLTQACRKALSGMDADRIPTVLGDLNGEAHRAIEWSTVEIRCFEKNANPRRLLRPAEYYGDIGAAAGAVLPAIAAQGFMHQWLSGPALIFCTDDHGACGALVIAAPGCE